MLAGCLAHKAVLVVSSMLDEGITEPGCESALLVEGPGCGAMLVLLDMFQPRWKGGWRPLVGLDSAEDKGGLR